MKKEFKTPPTIKELESDELLLTYLTFVITPEARQKMEKAFLPYREYIKGLPIAGHQRLAMDCRYELDRRHGSQATNRMVGQALIKIGETKI